jgi:Protein of unknown function (DUF4199)
MEQNPTIEKPSVMAVGVKYGLFIGIASILFTLVLVAFGSNYFVSDWKKWIGFPITIALVVLSHREFKGKGDGFMSFGQGFGITFISILVSVIIGIIFSYCYASFIDTSAMEDMYQKTAEDMEAKGQNQEAIDIAISWTKKLFWVFYFAGGVFFAAIIGVIIPIFTQKKNPTPTYL